MQNCTDNANQDVPLTVINLWYFQFPLRCAPARLEKKKRKKKQSWSNVFFLKNIFIEFSFYDNNLIQMSQLTRYHM